MKWEKKLGSQYNSPYSGQFSTFLLVDRVWLIVTGKDLLLQKLKQPEHITEETSLFHVGSGNYGHGFGHPFRTLMNASAEKTKYPWSRRFYRNARSSKVVLLLP